MQLDLGLEGKGQPQPSDRLGDDGRQPTASDKWDEDAARRILDDLYTSAQRFRTLAEYRELLEFVVRFRTYSPFNAVLIHAQMPGAVFVAPAARWWSDYGWLVKPNARPLVILRPMGPVMFVYDVSDVERGPQGVRLPRQVEHPHEVYVGSVGREYVRTIENAARDGIRVSERAAGSQSAGQIRSVAPGRTFPHRTVRQREPQVVRVPLRYELVLNSSLSPGAKYATLTHELAHLYCGHLGTPDPRWWPDRRGNREAEEEFEAESVSYLVCSRLGIETPSAAYLSGYMEAHKTTPAISLDCVMKVAGQIEQMGRQYMEERKPPKS